MQIKKEIQNVLFQNVFIPAVMGTLSCLLLALIFYKYQSANGLIKHTDDVIASISRVQKLISEAQAGARGYLLSSKDFFLEPYAAARTGVDETTKSLLDLVQDNVLQTKRSKEAQALVLDWFVYTEETLRQSRVSMPKAIVTMANGEGERKIIEIKKRLEELLDEEYRLKESRTESLSSFYRLSAFLFIPFLVFGNVFIAYRGRRSVLNIADSYDARLEQIQSQMAYQEREAWLQETEVKISATLIRASKIQGVAEEALGFFLADFGALAGSVFIKGSNKRELFQRIASVGVDLPKAHGPEVFGKNSIHARSLLAKKPTVCHDFAENKWNLQSGLGSHTPRWIVVSPILFSGECIAMIELAFTEKPEDKVIEFFDHSTGRLGGIFANEISKDELATLNENLRDQSEALHSQQEELKVTNEELEHRANLLRDSQKKLEDNATELQEANELLKQQAISIEEQKERLDQRNQEMIAAQNALEQHAQALEKASQYKSQFLANMSHELRTPLNSSMILAQLLVENREKNLTPKQVENAAQIVRSGQDLLALISDILDLSKVESGKMEVEIQTFQVNELIKWAKTSFEPLCKKKSLNLEITAGQKNLELNTDRTKLQQIVGNLLSNAIKFTSSGQISLEFSPQKYATSDEKISFIVKDTGIGIPKD